MGVCCCLEIWIETRRDALFNIQGASSGQYITIPLLSLNFLTLPCMKTLAKPMNGHDKPRNFLVFKLAAENQWVWSGRDAPSNHNKTLGGYLGSKASMLIPIAPNDMINLGPPPAPRCDRPSNWRSSMSNSFGPRCSPSRWLSLAPSRPPQPQKDTRSSSTR